MTEITKNRGGAPLGNRNALRTGRRSDRHGLVLGSLGKRYEGIYRDVKAFRRTLEAQVPVAQGADNLRRIGLISEACRWELVSRIAQRLIADHPDLAPDQVLVHLNAITNATRNRNAAINRLLGDSPSPTDPWAAFDAMRAQQRQAASQAVQGSDEGTAGRRGDQEGPDA